MENTKEMVEYQEQPKPQIMQALDPSILKNRIQVIKKLMAEVMKEGVHYGKIPGCGDKPALLQPGAEILCATFMITPKFDTKIIDLGNGHREYQVTSQFIHNPSGQIVGFGVGLCLTKETKYRYRAAKRVCPACGAEAIFRSKFPPENPGWYCNERQGGCNAKFKAEEPAIIDQQLGRIENPDIADTYNTVWKMAKKRSFVDGSKTALAVSDMFEQDVDEEHILNVINPEANEAQRGRPETNEPQVKKPEPEKKTPAKKTQPKKDQKGNGGSKGSQQPLPTSNKSKVMLDCPISGSQASPADCEEKQCETLDRCAAYQGYKKSQGRKK